MFFSFFKEFVMQPQHIGAICPSSKYVAHAVRDMLPEQQTGLIVEVGPGTGAITRELLHYSKKDDQLLVIERSKHMAENLLKSFPHVHLTQGDAINIHTLLPPNQNIMALISSMPMITLQKEYRVNLLKQFFNVIMNGGLYINISYNPLSNTDMKKCGFKRIKHTHILRNVPPAHIECYKVERT